MRCLRILDGHVNVSFVEKVEPGSTFFGRLAGAHSEQATTAAALGDVSVAAVIANWISGFFRSSRMKKARSQSGRAIWSVQF